jgi:class 3 adenylate cyclase
VASVEVDDEAPAEARAEVDAGAVRPAQLRVASGGKIHLRSTTDDARHVKLEILTYATRAATAHVVSTLPEFRTIFSSDLLKRSTPLKVARVAILFSDLTGSTALYSKVGDAAAFRLVDDHFDLLREVVRAHEGTIVKTMGDAVMAAFTDTGRAVSAAARALARFEEFRRTRPHGDRIGLKIGVYSGPCYIVTANGLLDYFGQTVNVASRIQHLADSGQIVVEQSQLEELDDEARAFVALGERFEARVKGVESPLALVRASLVSSAPNNNQINSPHSA